MRFPLLEVGQSVLVGTTPEERAETRMWIRRIEFGITEPLANGFRFAEGLAMFKDRLHTIPEAASGLKASRASFWSTTSGTSSRSMSRPAGE